MPSIKLSLNYMDYDQLLKISVWTDFKKNCVKATDGFNHVLNHLYEKQQYLSELKQRKSHEIKTKGEYALTQASLKANEKITKAADMVHTTKANEKITKA